MGDRPRAGTHAVRQRAFQRFGVRRPCRRFHSVNTTTHPIHLHLSLKNRRFPFLSPERDAPKVAQDEVLGTQAKMPPSPGGTAEPSSGGEAATSGHVPASTPPSVPRSKVPNGMPRIVGRALKPDSRSDEGRSSEKRKSLYSLFIRCSSRIPTGT